MTVRWIAAVVTAALGIAGCSADLLRHVGSADLFVTDGGEPSLLAAYLFDGDLTDAMGGEAFGGFDVAFGEDRAGNESGALYRFQDERVSLPDRALPRTVSVWVRVSAPSEQTDDNHASLQVGLDGNLSDSEDWEHTELKLRVRYSAWSGDAHLSYEAGTRFVASGGYLDSEGVAFENSVGSSDPWQLGAWNHVALLWDRAGYVSLFVNGDVVGTTGRPIPEEALSSLGDLRIFSETGHHVPEDGSVFVPNVNIAIDDFLLFESALSADRIRALAEDRLELPAL